MSSLNIKFPCYIFVHKVIMISFEEENYVIEEGQNISVCIIITGQTDISILLDVSTQGEPSTFVSESINFECILDADTDDISLQEDQILISSSPSSRQCFDVEIIGDDFIEHHETALIELETTNVAVILTRSTTTITIRNSDCKINPLN